MNKNLWSKRYFTKDSPTSYPCPKCFIGHLKLIHIKAEITKEGKSLQAYSYPYGIEHAFSGIYQCSDSICGDVVAFTGLMKKDYEIPSETDEGNPSIEYATFYEPKFFFPNLRLFILPDEITKSIKDQIDLSFSLFFCDLSSCANKIRVTIEMILDDIKAPRYRMIKKKKKRQPLILHERIENYKKTNKTVSELMLAIKFIGNEGSHKGTLEVNDILDAYEILFQIVEIIYAKQKEKTLQLARHINTHKKPLSKLSKP